MNRRELLKQIGVASIGITAAGAAGLHGATGRARATGSQNFDTVAISSDDGTVDYVAVYGDTVVQWNGFERPAQSFEVISDVEILDADGNILWSGNVNTAGPFDLNQSSWGGSGEEHSGVGTEGTISSDVGLDSNGDHDPSTDWAIVQASDYSDPYGLPADPAPASHLAVDTDGGTATFTVVLTTTYVWYANADGTDEVFRKPFEATIPVEVTNEDTTASSSGSGGATGG